MYYGGGYEWEEAPMCSMCFENAAMYATAHSGIVLCGSPDCHTAYVTQECHAIECDEEEEGDEPYEQPVWWKKMMNRVDEGE